ncbi:MAG: hypothetical protein Q8O67_02890 [Deltaproteobacteria bacterium]|nr:hypothetical protein [Deltaproteobacteria bacterium]
MNTRIKSAGGFTLVEVMVASVMAFIIVAAGSELAASMVRAIRKYEEQGELGSRASISSAFIKSALGSTAYNWTAEHVEATTTTGSFGEGHCALSTNICPSTKLMRPLEICSSLNVDETTCGAPTTTSADAIKTVVPRDGTIEAVSIQDFSVGTLKGSTCSGTGNLSFFVKGSTTEAWAIDDLVMVTNNSHVNVGRVAVAFPANADPAVQRTLQLDLGGLADFGLDDGGDSSACSPSASLLKAEVMRIKQVIVKHDDASSALRYGERSSAAGAMAFSDLTAEVEDFGVRLEIARVPGPSSAPVGVHNFCTADATTVLYGANATLGAGNCNGERLNGNISVAPVLRVIGLQLGLVLRSSVATQIVNEQVRGVFDRAEVVADDKRLHRTIFFFLGLPNANAF